jgi:hypothetical protein
MIVWNGVKKRQNIGSKKKASSECESESSDDDDPIIRVEKFGKVIPAEHLCGEDSDAIDTQFLERLGNHSDILYRRLPNSEKIEIKQRIKNAPRDRAASHYGNSTLMPAIRGNRLDKESREMQ